MRGEFRFDRPSDAPIWPADHPGSAKLRGESFSNIKRQVPRFDVQRSINQRSGKV
jgi:hypothetical protein